MGLGVLVLDREVALNELSQWLASPGPHLAVVADELGHPLGTIDAGDLAASLAAAADAARPVRPVHESAPLRVAVERMVHERARALPVVDDAGRVVGLLTDLDALRWVARHPASEPP